MSTQQSKVRAVKHVLVKMEHDSSLLFGCGLPHIESNQPDEFTITYPIVIESLGEAALGLPLPSNHDEIKQTFTNVHVVVTYLNNDGPHREIISHATIHLMIPIDRSSAVIRMIRSTTVVSASYPNRQP